MRTYSAVVATAGGRSSLKPCIEAILRQTVAAKDVIVIGATPAERPPWLPPTVRFETERPSTSAQRNAGARLARGDLVLFVDDDNIIADDFSERLIEAVTDDVVGAAGVIQNDPRLPFWSSVLYAALGLGHTAFLARSSRLGRSGHVISVYQPVGAVDAGFIHLCCTAIVRDTLLAEPLDETFDGYVLGEDLDLAARLRSYGRLIQVPSALSTALDELSTSPTDPYALSRRHGEILALFRWRHRGNGIIGTLCWHWSNVGQALVLGLRGIRVRSWAALRGYRDGLSAARMRVRHDMTPSNAGEAQQGIDAP